MTIFDLDHVGVAVSDLTRAEIAYRELGFTLTERSFHMTTGADGSAIRSGTGNHCLILQRGYIELIAPTDAGYAGRLLGDLARYEGLHLVSLGTGSTEAATEFLSATSGGSVAQRRLKRPFSERGRAFEAAFDIIDLPAGAVSEAHVFAIRHVTPEVIWQPRLMTHANAATNLVSVTFCVENPAEMLTRLGSLFGAERDSDAVNLKAGRIVCLDVNGFRQRFGSAAPAVPSVGAMTLGTSNLLQTETCLNAGRVPFTRNETRLVVPATAACGVIIEFIS